MITMAQRIEALRTERGLSRPALSAALGFPKTAVEKFETGRQTPTQDQQDKLASYFGVSLFYLRGESDDPTRMESWLNTGYVEEEPAPRPVPRPAAPKIVAQSSAAGQNDSNMFSAFMKSKSFQDLLRATVLDVLRSPEGQELIAKAVRKEVGRR
ncbi:MAG: helix-turn-helix domain-containing protein [Dysosmobacter sp.]|nr:helix-turn-helix domain-containing protein [Dysosmobacter sp.]